MYLVYYLSSRNVISKRNLEMLCLCVCVAGGSTHACVGVGGRVYPHAHKYPLVHACMCMYDIHIYTRVIS